MAPRGRGRQTLGGPLASNGKMHGNVADSPPGADWLGCVETPWTREIELDEEALLRVVQGTLGENGTLVPLGSGWDYDAWLSGDWVVRVPRRRPCAEAISDEGALCEWLSARITWRMPRYEAWGELPGDPPTPVGFYRRVPGRPAIEVDPTTANRYAIGRELGAGLRQLHALDPRKAPPLPGLRMRPFSIDECVRRALDRLPSLAQASTPALARRVEDCLRGPRPEPYVGSARIVHADIHGEHLLLTLDDPAELSGVIDWGDTRVGDPALDFACPTFWGGQPLLDAMLEGYGAPPEGENEEALAERVRFLALCLGFLDVDYYVRIGQRVYANAVVRAFDALTSNWC